jgi:hypothetical protein
VTYQFRMTTTYRIGLFGAAKPLGSESWTVLFHHGDTGSHPGGQKHCVIAAALTMHRSSFISNDWYLTDVRAGQSPKHVIGKALEELRWQHACSLNPLDRPPDGMQPRRPKR